MNRKALDLIAQQAGWPGFHCAVQGRLGGSKGVWLLHPDHQLPDDSPPKVWIRDSQKKITHDFSSGLKDGRSRAYFVFDLVAPTRLVFPTRLNRQTITNLSSNGVPTPVFVEMLEAAVRKDFEDLTTWEGSEAMDFLLSNVARLGGVSAIRAVRKAGTMARLQGLRGREMEDLPPSQSSDLGFVEGDWDPETSSGPPSVLSEKIFDMIVAGFHPLRSEPLYDFLKQLILNVIRAYVRESRIPVPESCDAFIVPGASRLRLFGCAFLTTRSRSLWGTRTRRGILPCQSERSGRLGWHKIRHFDGSCSGTLRPYAPRPAFYLVILQQINRNPTMLPSDIQRVTAVDKYHDIYWQYRDVIVCSVKGEQSLASKLAGGGSSSYLI